MIEKCLIMNEILFAKKGCFVVDRIAFLKWELHIHGSYVKGNVIKKSFLNLLIAGNKKMIDFRYVAFLLFIFLYSTYYILYYT